MKPQRMQAPDIKSSTLLHLTSFSLGSVCPVEERSPLNTSSQQAFKQAKVPPRTSLKWAASRGVDGATGISSKKAEGTADPGNTVEAEG